MRPGTVAAILLAACSGFGPRGAAQHAEHVMLDPSELVWKELPSLPGVKMLLSKARWINRCRSRSD